MKRSLIYFLVFFVISCVIGFFVSFGGRVTGLPVFSASAQLLLPVLTFVFGYFYFRKSKNDWSDRLFTMIGWTVGFIVLTTALAQPVYGLQWNQLLTLDTLSGYWIIAVCILVAGMIAPRTPFTNLR